MGGRGAAEEGRAVERAIGSHRRREPWMMMTSVPCVLLWAGRESTADHSGLLLRNGAHARRAVSTVVGKSVLSVVTTFPWAGVLDIGGTWTWREGEERVPWVVAQLLRNCPSSSKTRIPCRFPRWVRPQSDALVSPLPPVPGGGLRTGSPLSMLVYYQCENHRISYKTCVCHKNLHS